MSCHPHVNRLFATSENRLYHSVLWGLFCFMASKLQQKRHYLSKTDVQLKNILLWEKYLLYGVRHLSYYLYSDCKLSSGLCPALPLISRDSPQLEEYARLLRAQLMSYISTGPEPEVMLCTASCPLVSEFGKHNFGEGRQWAVDFNSCESLLPVSI